MERRWLNITGICTVLQMTEGQVNRLVKQGYLVKLPAPKKADARYLDPTPEYVRRLQMGEALHNNNALPIDLGSKPLITLREIAQILGHSHPKYARKYVAKRKLKPLVVGKFRLYRVDVVRQLLWERQGRKMAHQRAPFLLEELVEWFMTHQAFEASLTPTDAEYEADDRLQKKLERLATMPSPFREQAMREFYEKVALAKTVANSIKNPSP